MKLAMRLPEKGNRAAAASDPRDEATAEVTVVLGKSEARAIWVNTPPTF